MRAAPPLLAFLALIAGGSLASPWLAAAPSTVAIGIPRSLTCFPLHAARELGYFDEEGVSVTFAELEESEVPDALRTGRVDLACGPAVLPLEALQRGHRLQLVMAVQERGAAALVARIEAQIAPGDVAALRGRRVGTPEGQGGLGLALRAILTAGGLNSHRDVRLEAVGARRLLVALQSGRLDAAMLPGDLAAQAVERQRLATAVVDLRRGEGPPGAQAIAAPTLQGSVETLRHRAEAVGRVVRAVARGQRRVREDRELAAQVADRAFAGTDPQLIRAVLEAEAPSYHPGIRPEAIGHIVATLRALRGIRSVPTYGQIVAEPFRSLWNE